MSLRHKHKTVIKELITLGGGAGSGGRCRGDMKGSYRYTVDMTRLVPASA